jgi:large subunit ribosomal protein L6
VIPDKVSVTVGPSSLTVQGPKGVVVTPVPKGVACAVADGKVTFSRSSDEGHLRAKHGMARALAANAIRGVSDGFERRLEIVGVGYRAQPQGGGLQLALGYSHPIEFKAPQGITLAVEEGNKLVVRGVDKQLVGQVAAQIRGLRPPDPYKGKGIRHAGELIRLKAGKTGAK